MTITGTGDIEVRPDTDDVACRTWTWECGGCDAGRGGAGSGTW